MLPGVPALYPLPRLLTFHFQMGTSCGIYMLRKKQQLYTLAYPVWRGSIAAEFDTSSNLMGLSICPLIWLSAAPSRLLGKAFRSSEKREEADRFSGRQRLKDTFLESSHLIHFFKCCSDRWIYWLVVPWRPIEFLWFPTSATFLSPFFKNRKGANK